MELQPYFADQILSASAIVVRVNQTDRDRAEALVAETTRIKAVSDQESFQRARAAAGQLKSMLNEIEDAEKAAKRPFRAVESAINGVAAEVAEPVETEQDRILALLNGYVRKLEAARAEEERRERQKREAERAEADRRIREALQAKREAELKAQQAQDEVERLAAKVEADQRAKALEQAELERELGAELIGVPVPRRGLVPGGRVDHPRTYRITDVYALAAAKRLDLLRYEVDVRACNDEIRRQLDKFPDREPEIPGIEITTNISVSVKAQAGARLY